MNRLTLTINGAASEFERVLTVAQLLKRLRGATTAGVAVAINDTVVPRQRWADAELADGDRVEIITAVQGG